MYIIHRLWFDASENREAFGWNPIGVVSTEEEANRITDLEWIPRSSSPWPLNYVGSPKKDSVPRFRAQYVNNLDGLSLADLRNF